MRVTEVRGAGGTGGTDAVHATNAATHHISAAHLQKAHGMAAVHECLRLSGGCDKARVAAFLSDRASPGQARIHDFLLTREILALVSRVRWERALTTAVQRGEVNLRHSGRWTTPRVAVLWVRDNGCLRRGGRRRRRWDGSIEKSGNLSV